MVQITETKETLAQAQLKQLYSVLMEPLVRNWDQQDSNKEPVEDMVEEALAIGVAVYKHVQKEGSMDGLKVKIGACLLVADQNQYISSSLLDDLIDKSVDPNKTADYKASVWPSSIKGLVITREEFGAAFRYFLVKDSQPQMIVGVDEG